MPDRPLYSIVAAAPGVGGAPARRWSALAPYLLEQLGPCLTQVQGGSGNSSELKPAGRSRRTSADEHSLAAGVGQLAGGGAAGKVRAGVWRFGIWSGLVQFGG